MNADKRGSEKYFEVRVQAQRDTPLALLPA
jgi:hypothetical protein